MRQRSSRTAEPASPGRLRGSAPYLTIAAGIGALALGLMAISLGSTSAASVPASEEQLPIVVEQPRAVLAETTLAPRKNPQVVGHRGGSRWGAESTMPTIRHAADIGADGVEFDVRFTRDGVPVLMHDRTVDRTTTCTGLVTKITLKALKTCEVGTYVLGNPLSGERVPTLDEALAELAPTKLKVYVHMKSAEPAEAAKVVRILNKYKMNTTAGPANRTVVMADNSNNAEKLKLAGAKRVGLVIDRADEWNAPVQVIVVRGTPVTEKLVGRAHKQGKFVVAVEGWPVRSSQARSLDIDGFMADDLDAAVRSLGTSATRALAAR